MNEPKTIEDYGYEQGLIKSAIEQQKMNILIRRFNAIEALEFYRINRLKGSNMGKEHLQGRLMSYFIELQAMFKRRLNKEAYEELMRICFKSKEDDELIDAFFRINIELDNMGLTKIDTMKQKFNQKEEA